MENNTKIDMDTLNILIQKRNNCIVNLDENKSCETCVYGETPNGRLPCKNCYSELLGMPVNPTNWEKKDV